MNISGPPPTWIKFEEEDFVAYLRECPDYVTTRFNWKVYSFRHTGEQFAYVGEHGIWCSPKIVLKTS